jgi:alkylation response protein AidB-like acyl-CoA dehydrogenase
VDTTGILASIRDSLPAIRDRAPEIERARRMPRDLAEALTRTGMFSLTVPRAIGGLEASPLEVMRSIELVATADGSAGWCAMIGVANNVAAGYMPESGAREVSPDPRVPSAGIAAPAGAATRENGGFRVSGRWSFASGITHCEWVWAGCLVLENGKPRMTPHGPEMVHVFMPVRDVVIHDTWHVSGLCGTGSNDFQVADLLVPEHRTFALLDPACHRPEPLYQMPALGLFVYQAACVSLGIGRGALDELAALAQAKTPTLYTVVLADRAVIQVDLARAEAMLGAARAFLYSAVDDIWQTVCAGRAPTPRQVAMGRMAAAHAAEVGNTVTQAANRMAGGSSIYAGSSLQRRARDAEAITHHFTVAPHAWEEAGRVLLGRTPIAPAF